jgi:hypothetical protein
MPSEKHYVQYDCVDRGARSTVAIVLHNDNVVLDFKDEDLTEDAVPITLAPEDAYDLSMRIQAKLQSMGFKPNVIKPYGRI